MPWLLTHLLLFAMPSQVLRFKRILDPRSQQVIERGIVITQGERIIYVGTDASRAPSGAIDVDWSAYTGLPGLIDAHTHVSYVADETSRVTPWEQLERLSKAQVLVLSRRAMEQMLRIGVTTAIDKGGVQQVDFSLRSEQGAPGPRLFIAGEGIYTGSVTGPEAIARKVKEQLAAGVDLIKVWADDCTDHTLVCSKRFSREELKAAVDAAEGKPVAIHAYHASVAVDAVWAGASSLEHSVDLDDATLVQMAKRGIVFVPTIEHNRYYAAHLHWFGFSAEDKSALTAFADKGEATTRRAIAKGVAVALGSDAVFSMLGRNTNELRGLVRAGMTPMQALRAATFTAAQSIGKQRELGSLAPGFFADIIAVEGDPRDDIDNAITRVRHVMKAGQIF